jgi:hypothetical protein
MKQQYLKLLLVSVVLLLALLGCGGEKATPTPIIIVVTAPPAQPGAVTVVVTPPPPQAGIELKAATFAHGLTDDMQPVDAGSDFAPEETVYLSLQIKGRPEEGMVTARFYWHDSSIAEAGVDLADVNSGLLFSSDQYRAEVFYNDQPLGTYPFRVVPPAEAIPSQVTQVTLALGADENYDPVDPTTTFAPDQAVYLVGAGDLGLATWIQADWYVNDQLDEAGTRSITLDQNIPGAGFSFSFLPEGGWPAGEHFVVLTMNDQEVGRYSFTIVSPGG